jgi:glutamate/tyrosine decarboxylase-like PLP-dependent enzyme
MDSETLFCFRHHPSGVGDEAQLDRLNEALLHRLNDDGRSYFTQTRVTGRYAIRFSIGSAPRRGAMSRRPGTDPGDGAGALTRGALD